MQVGGRRGICAKSACAPAALVGLLLAAGLLGGCAGGGLSKPSLAVPAAYQGRLGADTALSQQTLDAWWRLYDDPQLTVLVEEGLRNNYDVRTSLERIREQRAARAQTLSAYLPQGDLLGQALEQNISESFGGVGVTTNLGTTTSTSASGSAGSTGVGVTTGAPATPAWKTSGRRMVAIAVK